jgi:hypothetical protein
MGDPVYLIEVRREGADQATAIHEAEGSAE